ncbi:hypothetical protein [Actinoplanes sp. NPDC051851]|uniref:NACHT domain-containing protein n=1 Tax=Actinoplanes sp. NPDC051851 TaxID=3154753 RepID=UPI003428C480
MGDYPLNNLGSTEFEHLSQALLMAIAGPANVKIYGAGRDGGRELTTSRSFGVAEGLGWTGYTVALAKFHNRAESAQANATWLRSQIRTELADWIDTRKNRQPKPNNLLFITNVVLSAVPGHGVDAMDEVFAEFADKLPLRDYAVWHYSHVCRLLDDHPKIAEKYAGFLTAGDVLTQLHDTLRGQNLDLAAALHQHAAKELIAEQWVRLGESGSRTNDKLQLAQVGVDLTASAPPNSTQTPTPINVLHHLIALGNQSLRPSIHAGPSPHQVLVGGPGQGKTTVGQLLCQLYRANLIEDLRAIGPQASAVVTAMQPHLTGDALPAMTNRRWPLRLDLSAYADVLGGSPQTSILRHLADRITARGTDTITAPHLKTWLGSWPWLLVLDGFDEVVAPQVREAMIDRINDFLVDAAAVDADLLIVATTRPQGYNAEFTADHYQHLHLHLLTSDEAETFARKIADVRLADDPDARTNVTARVAEAARDRLTARLMVTPLQVTIMSLLLEGSARAPQDRYSLFAAYYETIYSREMNKRTPTAQLLERHRRTIDQLHERVGLMLQIDAEHSGKADAAIARSDVEGLARQILEQEDHPTAQVDGLATQIAIAATNRLVLLVPKHTDDVGFDVRSLQELMAARALTTGPDTRIVPGLAVIAMAGHWRNTLLLAAGRLARDRNHLVDELLNMLEDLDTTSYLALYLHPAAGLALDLLDDHFAAPSPRVERRLVQKAVGALQSPPTGHTPEAAVELERVSRSGSRELTAYIADAAKSSLQAEPPLRITAVMMMILWARNTGALPALSRLAGSNWRQRVGPDHAKAITTHYSTWEQIRANISKLPEQSTPKYRTVADYLSADDDALPEDYDAQDEKTWRTIMRVLGTIRVTAVGESRVPVIEGPVTTHAAELPSLRDNPRIADHLATLLTRLDPDDWAIASTIADLIRVQMLYEPVGDKLNG